MKAVLLFFVRVYQRFFSVDSGFMQVFFPGTKVCRFTPTCSEYMYQAISRYGIIQGLKLGVQRISRCHPWNTGGYDPIPTLENRKGKIEKRIQLQ